MNHLKPKYNQPEKKIRDDVVLLLRSMGWFAKVTHGNEYQSGLPDIFASHKTFRQRWIEIKLPGMIGSRFTSAQYDTFPLMVANGAPIWILTAATKEEYEKLFQPSNLWLYMR